MEEPTKKKPNQQIQTNQATKNEDLEIWAYWQWQALTL